MQTSQGQVVMAQGRIVWVHGDLFKGQIKTEFNSKVPKLNQQGEQIREYGFGLAIPKAALQDVQGSGKIWAAMHEEAQKLFPNIPPTFSMKYKDGDGVDHKGIPFNKREGYQGCIVLSCTTTLPIKYYKYEAGQNIMVNEGIKCGDYVNVQLQVKAHAAMGQGKPGLYLNPLAVQLVGYGTEIINTPSPDVIFGTSMPSVPQGASSTPVAPQGQAFIVPPSQAQGAAPQVQPNYNVVPPPHQPQAVNPQVPQAYPQPAQAPQAAPSPMGMPMPPGFGQ